MREAWIKGVLESEGYKRVEPLVYRAPWSTSEVEHLLFFSFYGSPKDFLAADFGFRNGEAEIFGIQCVRNYGGEIYRGARSQSVPCAMRFPLGKLLGWSPRHSMYLPGTSDQTKAEAIKIGIEERLLPLAQGISDHKSLLETLVADDEPFRWLYVNGAIRAAQIACLAQRIGVKADDVGIMLQRYEKEISASLPRNGSAQKYIEGVMSAIKDAVR